MSEDLTEEFDCAAAARVYADLQDKSAARLSAATMTDASMALHEALELLKALGYIAQHDDGSYSLCDLERDVLVRNRQRLLELAASLKRVFLLPMPEALGLRFVAAEIATNAFARIVTDNPSVGTGAAAPSLQLAFQCSIGEAAEYLSYLRRDDDAVINGTIADVLEALPKTPAGAVGAPLLDGPASLLQWISGGLGMDGLDRRRTLEWVELCALDGSGSAYLPADLCYRRPLSPDSPARRQAESNGCAAGPTAEHAIAHALCEALERHAVAHWWYGGRAAKRLHPEAAGLADEVAALRQGYQGRRYWCLELTPEREVKIVVALSTRLDGRGLACGAKADLDVGQAARRALREMMHMELSLSLSAAKLHNEGPTGMQPTDWLNLERLTHAAINDFPELRPTPTAPMRATAPMHATRSAASPEDLTAAALADVRAMGSRAYWLDITRMEIGIPAARVLVPGLQSAKADWMSAALSRTMVENRRDRGDLERRLPLF